MLLRWRYGHDDPLASIAAGACAAVLLIAAVVTGIRSSRNRRAAGDLRNLAPDTRRDAAAELFVADTLLLTGRGDDGGRSRGSPSPARLGAVHAGLGAAILLAGGDPGHAVHRPPRRPVHGGGGPQRSVH